jgi:hypothetical protein
MRAAIHDHLEGKLSDEAFDAPAEDATRAGRRRPARGRRGRHERQ